jgi:hypothetical protein
MSGYAELLNFLIPSQGEKWDSLTRNWYDGTSQVIDLV